MTPLTTFFKFIVLSFVANFCPFQLDWLHFWQDHLYKIQFSNRIDKFSKDQLSKDHLSTDQIYRRSVVRSSNVQKLNYPKDQLSKDQMYKSSNVQKISCQKITYLKDQFSKDQKSTVQLSKRSVVNRSAIQLSLGT